MYLLRSSIIDRKGDDMDIYGRVPRVLSNIIVRQRGTPLADGTDEARSITNIVLLWDGTWFFHQHGSGFAIKEHWGDAAVRREEFSPGPRCENGDGIFACIIIHLWRTVWITVSHLANRRKPAVEPMHS